MGKNLAIFLFDTLFKPIYQANLCFTETDVMLFEKNRVMWAFYICFKAVFQNRMHLLIPPPL